MNNVWAPVALATAIAAGCAAGAPRPAEPGLFGTTAWHADGTIEAISFRSHETEVVVVSSGDGVEVFDATSGGRVRRIEGTGTALDMALPENDTAILVGERSSVVDLRTGHRGDLALPPGVVGMATDGAKIVGYEGANRALRVFDLASKAFVIELSGSEHCEFPSFVRDWIVAKCDHEEVAWDLGGHRNAITTERQFGLHATFDPTNRVIVTNDQQTLEVRRLDGTLVHAWPLECVTGAAAFSPDGAILAVACDGVGVFAFDVARGGELVRLPPLADDAHVVAFSPSGRLLAVGGDSALHLWTVDGWRRRDHGAGHDGAVTRMMVDHAGDRLLTTSVFDHTARLWNTRTGALVRTFDHVSEAVTTLDPAGSVVIARGLFGRLCIGCLTPQQRVDFEWWRDKRVVLRRTIRGIPEPLAIAARPKGELAVIVDGRVMVSDAAGVEIWRSTELVSRFEFETNRVRFTADGGVVALVRREAVVVVDIDRRTELARVNVDVDMFQGVSVSPDRRLLAVAANDVVRLYRLPGGDEMDRLDLTTDSAGATDLTFTDDPNELIVLSRERLVVWHPGVSKQVRALHHADSLAWRGGRLFVGMSNGTIALLARNVVLADMQPF